MPASLSEIVSRFGIQSTAITPVNQGGFSGARVCRVTDSTGQSFGLKRHEGMTADHLTWVHRVLMHTKICDCDFVAIPQKTKDGLSYVEADGGLWEVNKWMPGEADFHTNPSDDRLTNAMQSLAKFHQAAAQVNLDFRPSPGVTMRIAQLTQLPAMLASVQGTHADFPTLQNILMLLKRMPASKIQNHITALNVFAGQMLPLQPAIRDLWHDHLLFTGDQLTGLIDFDAMKMDSIALDLTRCLASLVPDDLQRWATALNAYSSVRPIQQAEAELINTLDPVNLILSAANWVKWIAVEQRHFDPTLTETRLQMLAQRLGKRLGKLL